MSMLIITSVRGSEIIPLGAPFTKRVSLTGSLKYYWDMYEKIIFSYTYFSNVS